MAVFLFVMSPTCFDLIRLWLMTPHSKLCHQGLVCACVCVRACVCVCVRVRVCVGMRACACARIRSGLPRAPSSASGTLDFGQRFASLGREPSALWLQDSGQGHRVSCAWRRQSSAGASALPIFRARVRPRSECAPSADPLRPEAARGRSCVLQ